MADHDTHITASNNPLDTQEDGDHYKALGQYQPAEVLNRWLTPDEYRGWIKGNAIVYLARERAKGGTNDIAKARHMLQIFEHLARNAAQPERTDQEQAGH